MVAGLSGSGKSTFIRALAEGRLPDDLMRHIPEAADSWPHTSCKFLLDNGIDEIFVADKAPDGLVMHYNMSRLIALSLPDYWADEGLKFLDDLDAKISIITIIVDRETIVNHIHRRSTDAQWIAEDLEGSPMLRKLRRKLRAIVYNRLGLSDFAIKKGQLRLIRHYESAGSIELWLECWEAYLERIRKIKQNTSFIYVSPDPASTNGPNFRLLKAP